MRPTILTVLVMGLAVPAGAQLTRGAITGAIQDAAGAFVAKVNIEAANRATGVSSKTESNSWGIYRLAPLEPGHYDLEFVKDGFQPLRVENIQLGTGQDIVLDLSFAVATVTSGMTVVAAGGALELSRSSATLDRYFSNPLLESLPLSAGSYDYWELTLLAPNVVRTSDGIPSRRISVNGQRRASTNFMIDGVDNNEFFLGIPAQYPPREEISEVRVQTSTYSAEFGRSPAQFAIVSRSGTNQFHGETWDYYGGSVLNAASLADKRAGLDRSRSLSNYFGVALGGPAIRNRTFFHLTGSTTRRRDGLSVRGAMPVRLPTPIGFAALSKVPLGTGQPPESRRAVLDPLRFLPEVYGQIRRWENFEPVNIGGVDIETATARIPFRNAVTTPAVAVRADHQLSRRDTITARFRLGQQFTPNTDAFATNLGFGERFSTAQFIKGRNDALSYTRIFSPRWTNEARLADNYLDIDYRNKTNETSAMVLNLFALGPSFLAPSRTITSTTQFQDVATFLTGRHSWKAGVDLRRLRFYQVLANGQRGAWVFPSLAGFLNNQAVQLRQFVGTPAFETHLPMQHAFVQDDVKVTPRLTLNVGLRYETAGVPFGFFGATRPDVAAIGVPGPVRSDRNNWAPRGGFAYSPAVKNRWLGDGATVFRGGFGIAYNSLFQQIIDTRDNYPRAQILFTLPPRSFHLYPQLKPAPSDGVAVNPLAAFTNLPVGAQYPTTNFYSFSVQRQWKQNFIAELGFSGSRNYHLTRRSDANPALLTEAQARDTVGGLPIPDVQSRRMNPAWGARAIVDPSVSSYYNALFLRLDRRMARGLLFGANFTFSSNLSENDDEPPQRYSCSRCDYSRSNLDRPDRLAVHFLYQIPWRGGGSRILREIFSGWQTAGFGEWQSGQPFAVTTGVDSVGTGVSLLPQGAPGLFPMFTGRPDYNASGVIAVDQVNGGWRSFAMPRDGTGLFLAPRRTDGSMLADSMPYGGNLGRNTLRGPAFWNCNVSLMKTIRLTERVRLRFRTEWINVLNHRNVGPPVADMNSLDFGRNLTAPVSRAGQLVGKLRF